MIAADPRTETVSDLLDRLGGIPASRVRMRPLPGTATEADLELAPKPICELIDGTLVEKPMGARESLLAAYVGRRLGEYADNNDLGVMLGADGFVRVFPGQIRAPDVTFIPWTEFPNDEIPEDEFAWSVAPGLIVEVLSPTNTAAEIDRKLRELFAAGCKLAWVIDPESKTAKVHTSAKKSKELDESGVLDGGKVVPGFSLRLADVFAAGKRRKNNPR